MSQITETDLLDKVINSLSRTTLSNNLEGDVAVTEIEADLVAIEALETGDVKAWNNWVAGARDAYGDDIRIKIDELVIRRSDLFDQTDKKKLKEGEAKALEDKGQIDLRNTDIKKLIVEDSIVSFDLRNATLQSGRLASNLVYNSNFENFKPADTGVKFANNEYVLLEQKSFNNYQNYPVAMRTDLRNESATLVSRAELKDEIEPDNMLANKDFKDLLTETRKRIDTKQGEVDQFRGEAAKRREQREKDADARTKAGLGRVMEAMENNNYYQLNPSKDRATGCGPSGCER